MEAEHKEERGPTSRECRTGGRPRSKRGEPRSTGGPGPARRKEKPPSSRSDHELINHMINRHDPYAN
jgi:hypothetical protein